MALLALTEMPFSTSTSAEPVRQTDGIAATARLRPGGIVDVELPQLDTKGAVDRKSVAMPLGAVDVPAEDFSRPIEPDVAIIAADQLYVLDPSAPDVGLRIVGTRFAHEGRCGSCGAAANPPD